jgi:hypothetical protein
MAAPSASRLRVSDQAGLEGGLDLDVLAGLWDDDDGAACGGPGEDDGDVAGAGGGAVGAGVEDEVAGVDLAGGDLLAPGPLLLAGAGDVDAGGAVGQRNDKIISNGSDFLQRSPVIGRWIEAKQPIQN